MRPLSGYMPLLHVLLRARPQCHDNAGTFVTADQRQLGGRRPVAFQRMQVRMAHSREENLRTNVSVEQQSKAEGHRQNPHTHPHKHLSRVELRLLGIVELLDRDLVRSAVLVEDGHAVRRRKLQLRLARIPGHFGLGSRG